MGPNGKVWTNTMTGIRFSDGPGQPAQLLQHPNFKEGKFVNVSGFSTARDGKTWFVVRDQGLYYWDPDDNKVHEALIPSPFHTAGQWHLEHDPDQDRFLWIASTGGLFRIDKTNMQADSFLVSRMDTSLQSDFVNFFTFDTDGSIWMGIRGGIAHLDPDTRNLQTYLHDPQHDFCIPASIRGICMTEAGVFAATGRGIMHLDPDTGNCILIGPEDGLQQENISGVTADHHGRIWAHTLSYLYVYDPADRSLIHYRIIRSIKEFNTYAADTGADGHLLFGGTNGYFAFIPEDVPVDTLAPTPVLTGFKVFNEAFSLGQTPEYTRQINLSYEEKVITFEFAGLHFTDSESNTFRYYLEGFDAGWQEVANKRDVTYTNLSPGRYRFHLNTANADGVWNESPLVVDLNIAPPYWQTAWFFSLVLLLLGGLIFAWVRNRQKGRILAKEKEIAERSARYKSLFLANMRS